MKTPSLRQLTLLLAVSLALNLFLGGLVAARWVFGRDRAAHFGGPRDLRAPDLFRARRVLAEESRPIIDEVHRHHREQLRASMRGHRAARADVHRALTQEPFDSAELGEALTRLRQRTVHSQEQLHTALVELAGRLPLEECRKLAAAHQRRGPRKWRRERP